MRKNRYALVILLCLTLGLAPFTPEPHLVGKWRWLIGGAEGMGLMDWFDLCLHSTPFILLLALIAIDIRQSWSRKNSQSKP